jgi:hypothetical protein
VETRQRSRLVDHGIDMLDLIAEIGVAARQWSRLVHLGVDTLESYLWSHICLP